MCVIFEHKSDPLKVHTGEESVAPGPSPQPGSKQTQWISAWFLEVGGSRWTLQLQVLPNLGLYFFCFLAFLYAHSKRSINHKNGQVGLLQWHPGESKKPRCVYQRLPLCWALSKARTAEGSSALGRRDSPQLSKEDVGDPQRSEHWESPTQLRFLIWHTDQRSKKRFNSCSRRQPPAWEHQSSLCGVGKLMKLWSLI